MIYFIGDTHFGNAGMMQFDNSPFQSVDQMDRVIINNWNDAVTDNYVFSVTGDLSAKGKDI